jgi:RimJ/RimL family protein N-acetyltransferase
MTVLDTDRLYVRQWVPDDWKRLRPLVTDPRVLRHIGHGEPWPDDRTQRFVSGGIEKARTRGWVLWPVIHKADAELIGFCGFNDGFSPDVEIGWRLLPEYWGRGLATEAARAVLDYGFRRFAFPRVISVARPEDRASIRVMEKLGMQFDRRFVHDGLEVVAYAKAAPPAPRAGDDVRYSFDLGAIDWARMKARVAEDHFDNGRTPDQLRRSFENSHAACVAVADGGGGGIVGTARVLSDGVCNAYLVDVWTYTPYRRRGVARRMIELLIKRLHGQHVYCFTDDVVDFYKRLGFVERPTGLERVIGEWLNERPTG